MKEERFKIRFSYGVVPLGILICAIICTILVGFNNFKRKKERPDLIFTIFAPNHRDAYREAIEEFEKENNVKIQLQLVDERALRERLQSALLTDADVPDLVEILEGTIGYFTKGPVEDVGFVNLTKLIKEEGIYDAMVKARFSLWSKGTNIFALPHDVHPVMLAYRRDIVEKLGINVDKLTTWEKFTEVGRRITKDLDGDGNPDRYMIDLPTDGGQLPLLILQAGYGFFDLEDNVIFDNEGVADIIIWYIHQCYGKTKIAFTAGWGQTLAKVMQDGFVLFYFCPDWRTKQFEMDMPFLTGKLALMPLPAWKEGGCRTSTWGGTGLAIPKKTKNFKLAWKFAKKLYLDKNDLGKRFKFMYIIPPVKEAWNLPEFFIPNKFFSGQPIGKLYAKLAFDVPSYYVTAYIDEAKGKVQETYLNAVEYFKKNGDKGLKEYTIKELKNAANYIKKLMERNKFL